MPELIMSGVDPTDSNRKVRFLGLPGMKGSYPVAVITGASLADARTLVYTGEQYPSDTEILDAVDDLARMGQGRLDQAVFVNLLVGQIELIPSGDDVGTLPSAVNWGRRLSAVHAEVMKELGTPAMTMLVLPKGGTALAPLESNLLNAWGSCVAPDVIAVSRPNHDLRLDRIPAEIAVVVPQHDAKLPSESTLRDMGRAGAGAPFRRKFGKERIALGVVAQRLRGEAASQERPEFRDIADAQDAAQRAALESMCGGSAIPNTVAPLWVADDSYAWYRRGQVGSELVIRTWPYDKIRQEIPPRENWRHEIDAFLPVSGRQFGEAVALDPATRRVSIVCQRDDAVANVVAGIELLMKTAQVNSFHVQLEVPLAEDQQPALERLFALSKNNAAIAKLQANEPQQGRRPAPKIDIVESWKPANTTTSMRVAPQPTSGVRRVIS